MAVKTYIEGKVPSTVQFEVFEPCSQCHALWNLEVKVL
jgi:hypothetical protein